MGFKDFAPGESDYAEHLLRTAALFIRKDRLLDALRLLEAADDLDLAADEHDALDGLLDVLIARGEARLRESATHHPAPEPPRVLEGRLLPFRSVRRERAPLTAAAVSSPKMA